MASTIQSDTTKHLSDLVAANKHILEAVESQLSTTAVKENPEAHMLLAETGTLLQKYIRELDIVAEQYDTETKASLKKLFTNVLGNLAGAYNHLRGEGAARAVRDTYTALNLLNASLLALKTFGLMVNNAHISKLAYDQMVELCPLIVKYNKTIPFVVARETAKEDGVPYDSSVPARVLESTQKLWS